MNKQANSLTDLVQKAWHDPHITYPLMGAGIGGTATGLASYFSRDKNEEHRGRNAIQDGLMGASLGGLAGAGASLLTGPDAPPKPEKPIEPPVPPESWGDLAKHTVKSTGESLRDPRTGASAVAAGDLTKNTYLNHQFQKALKDKDVAKFIAGKGDVAPEAQFERALSELNKHQGASATGFTGKIAPGLRGSLYEDGSNVPQWLKHFVGPLGRTQQNTLNIAGTYSPQSANLSQVTSQIPTQSVSPSLTGVGSPTTMSQTSMVGPEREKMVQALMRQSNLGKNQAEASIATMLSERNHPWLRRLHLLRGTMGHGAAALGAGYAIDGADNLAKKYYNGQ